MISNNTFTNNSPKKKIAFVTPWPPEMTGVGDYAYDLICGLNNKNLFEITVVTSCENPQPVNGLIIISCTNEQNIPDLTGQDLIIHEFGNNQMHLINYWVIKKYGGIVQLHDLVLHDLVRRICHTTGKENRLYHFLTRFYVTRLMYRILRKLYGPAALFKVLRTIRKPNLLHSIIEKWYGPAAVDIEKNLERGGGSIPGSRYVIDFPLFEEMVQYSDGVIAHSEFATNRIQKAFPSLNVIHNPLQYDLDKTQDINESYIPPGKFLIGTFGFSDWFKHTDKIVKAFVKLLHYCDQENLAKPILLVVGPGDFSIEKKIAKQQNISDYVLFIPEPPLEKFNALLKKMNLVIQLRFPTRGETSAPATKAKQFGVPLIVSNVGWYKELPDFVEKTISPPDINHIFNTMRKVIFPQTGELKYDDRVKLSKAAAEYLNYDHYLDNYVNLINSFVSKIKPKPMIASTPEYRSASARKLKLIPETKLLVDISKGVHGYSGIPQDTRLLFSTLSQLDDIKTSALISAHSSAALRNNIENFEQRDIPDKVTATAMLLSQIVFPEPPCTHPQFILRFLQKIKHYRLLKKTTSFKMELINTDIFYDLIWRNIFSKSMPSHLYDAFRDNDFYISNINIGSISFHAARNRSLNLDTSQFDFAVFQDQRPYTVSENTTKIIRYHDAIPLTDIDTSEAAFGMSHANAMRLCTWDSFYVCNSEPTMESLLKINPCLERRSTVIPYMMPDFYHRKDDALRLKQIIENRAVHRKYLPEDNFNYVLSVGTLEPRKNYISLIHAFQKFILKNNNQSLKLIIVGNPGWKNAAILHEMQALIEKGILIHLENVAPEEMSYLYSHALTFVFPSYNEGFGMPPVEALLCECPVIASDIKAHRWVLGDAAMYCNPYDIDSIANCLEKMIAVPEAMQLRQDFQQKGLLRAQLYSSDAIKEQWQTLFAKLKAEKG